MTRSSVGMQIGATTAPNEIATVASEVEHLGYGEIWMAEDYFQLGGISSVATALAATQSIPVGLGVVAAAARHPAATAMEFATLGAVYPDRFIAGIGHGAAGWVRQMGLEPESPLGLLREATDAIRRLLAGAEVTREGEYFDFDKVRLHHCPPQPIPLYLGVHGPASLRLAGKLGDGTLLGWFSSPGYVTWARERIGEGQLRAGRDDRHQLVVLCVLSVSEDDPDGARQSLYSWAAPMWRAMAKSPQLAVSDEGQHLVSIVTDDGPPAPDELASVLGGFAAAGDLASCAATIASLLEAGADRVVLVPNPAGYRSTAEMLSQIRVAAALLRSQ